MKRHVLAILIFCAAAANAQSALGLQYPFGVPMHSVTGASAAMGGSGTAIAEEYFGMALNPANAGIGERAAFGAMVSYNITHIADNGSHSAVSGYAPKLLSLVIPISKAGNIGFAMQKRYDANLNFYTTEILQDDRDGFKSATIELHSLGGLTAWQAGWAYRFKNGLGVGLMYERLYFSREFGNVFESIFRYSITPNPVTHRSSTIETQNTTFASDGIRFGMQVPVNDKVTLGAAAEYILSGSGNARTVYDYRRREYQPIRDELLVHYDSTFSVTMPPSLNVGFAYRFDARLLLAADAWTTLWNNYENELEGNSAGRPTYGISAGARFIPAAGHLVSTYQEKMHYSAGLRYSTMPYDVTGAHEYAISFGVGLPIPNDGGIIDIAFDIGRRTDSRYSGYSENLIRIQLGINGGRNWFQRDAHGF